jgi:hypothetical protein
LSSTIEATHPTQQFMTLQLRNVLLSLPRSNAKFLRKHFLGRIAPPSVAGIAGKSAPCEFGSGADRRAPGETFRNKKAGEHPVGIERLASLKAGASRGFAGMFWRHSNFPSVEKQKGRRWLRRPFLG